VTWRARFTLAIVVFVPMLEQSVAADIDTGQDLACAPRAVCLALSVLDRVVSEKAIHDAFAGRVTGTHSYDSVTDAVKRLGCESCSAQLDPMSPRLARIPLIAAVKRSPASVEPNHFVVLYGSGRGLVQLLDFPNPPRLVPCEVLAQTCDGRGVYVAATRQDLPESAEDSWWIPAILIGGSATVSALSLALWRLARKRPTRGGNPDGRATRETSR